MLRSVPTGTSDFFGTMTVSTVSSDRRTNLTWLPFWLASTNPAASSRRLTSRKGCGLSRPNLNLYGANDWGTRGPRWFEVQLQRLLQVGESLCFALTLAGDIDFEALRNIPLSFAPDGRGERLLHDNILSQDGRAALGFGRRPRGYPAGPTLHKAEPYATGYTETSMSEISRRILLTGAAGAPLLAQQAAQTAAVPSPARDTVPKRHLLSGKCTAESLEKSLLERARWNPFPAAGERDAWNALAADGRESALNTGEAYLGKPYDPLPATLFLGYARNRNRSPWEGVQFGRRNHLRHTVLAECVEGKGRFLDDIADGIWAICEETFCGVPAHMGAQKRGVGLPDVQEPIIELFSAETGALLAWTHYLLGKQIDKVHPLIRERLEAEIERRLLKVYRSEEHT